MFRTASSRLAPLWLSGGALLLAGGAGYAAAQTPANAIISSEISTSSDQAELRLRLAGDPTLVLPLDGERVRLDGDGTLTLALDDGRIRLDGQDIGSYEPGDALDRSWRELLGAAASASAAELPALLAGWEAPGGAAGAGLDTVLEAAMTAAGGQQLAPATAAAPPAPAAPAAPLSQAQAGPMGDSLAELRERIAELEERIEEAREADNPFERLEALEPMLDRDQLEERVREELRQEFQRAEGGWFDRGGPLNSVWRGIGGIFSTLAIFAVLVGLGFVTVFFGRRYVEGVADTARHAMLRSWLVGLAASFLACPVFILGIIALAVSIIGIPLLLVWVPLFPVAVVVALLLGYLAVAHGAGEALAERRFHGGDWFKRANSYYYILTGVGLLLALFVASHVVEMAGSWLDFIHGLLTFLAVVLTWAAFTIGLGAVLISRGGTQPVRTTVSGEPGARPAFEEESHV